MHPLKALLSLLLVTLATVEATPLGRRTGKATLGFATNINLDERSTLGIIEKDRARAQTMKQTGQLYRRSMSLSATNTGALYTVEVGIGDPATNHTLLLDTGSANTFVGASQPYTPTHASKDTGNAVSVSYGAGSFSGEEWLDTVTLAPGLVVNQQSIGVAHDSQGFAQFGYDGILGLGPVDLTSGTVSNTDTVPTISDNLLSQGTVSEEVLGIYFIPSVETSSTGQLTFGGYDNQVIASSVSYVPLTTTSPASEYWGLDMSISYGGTTILAQTAGVVDSGTMLILIASDAFQKYQSATGGTLDSTTGLLSITPAQYADLKSLTFNIGGMPYDLPPNGQIWPRALNTAIGGNSRSIYLVVNDIGTSSGSGLDFTNGYTFLERFYTVFDASNGQLGFATTTYTNSTSN